MTITDRSITHAPTPTQPSTDTATGGRAPRPVAPATRLRRSRTGIGLGVALTAAGALGAYGLADRIQDTRQVLVLATDITAGHALTSADIAATAINPDTQAATIDAASVDELIGRYLRTDLGAGTVLDHDMLSSTANPNKTSSVVGVGVKPTQMPAIGLAAGDHIRVVATPGEQGQPTRNPASYTAVVVALGAPNDEGTITVDLSVPRSQAAGVAALAGTGNVALVLDSPAGVKSTGGN